VAEEKQAMAEYGSSDSGASLGDILGAALTRAREEGEESAEGEAPAAEAATAEASEEAAPAEEAPAEEVPAEEAAADEAAAEEPAADDDKEKS
jgi:hypothetical protein